MNGIKLKKLGGYAASDMLEAKLFNHGERSSKTRKKYFRALKKKERNYAFKVEEK